MSKFTGKAPSFASPPYPSNLSPPAYSAGMPNTAQLVHSTNMKPSDNPASSTSRSSHPSGSATAAHESQIRTPVHPSSTIDPKSAALIRGILRQEVDDVMDKTKGKQPNRGPSDIELALEQWDRELSAQEQLEMDFAMAKSLDTAVRDDGYIITMFQQDEARARADRQLAMRIARIDGRTEQTDPVPSKAERIHHVDAAVAGSSSWAGPSGTASKGRARPENCDVSEELKRIKLAHEPTTLKTATDEQTGRESPESSQRAKQQPHSATPEYACVSCNDPGDEIAVIQAPCSHHYCVDCLVQLVTQSIIDESLFPPRCCRMTLPLSIISVLIGPDLTRQYEEKSIERADPERTYCSNKTCSSYILPGCVSGFVGTCRQCETKTCMICKDEAHNGNCQTAVDDLLDIAGEKGWQQCICGHLVELNTGCNHMT